MNEIYKIDKETGKVTELLGIPVKATFKSAMIYRELTGSDYLTDVIKFDKMVVAMKNNDNSEEQMMESISFDTQITLNLLKSFALTVDPELDFDSAVEDIELGHMIAIITPIYTLVFNNAKTTKKVSGQKKGKTTGK